MSSLTRALLAWVVLAVLSLAAGSPALAQGRIDPELLRSYGGAYAVDCARPGGLRLTVGANALSAEAGGKSIRGTPVQAAAAYFGRSAPPDFRVALIGALPGGDELVFLVYQNAKGVSAAIDGGPKVQALVGKGAMGRRLPRCDSARQASTGVAPAQNPTPGPSKNPAQDAAPAPTPGPVPQAVISPPQLLHDPRFRTPYLRVLGPLTKEAWLMRLDGPAPAVRKVRVAGEEYELVSVCKPHDCANHNILLLYSAGRQIVYGRLHQAGRGTRLGAPPAQVAAELERLWRAEWRRKP